MLLQAVPDGVYTPVGVEIRQVLHRYRANHQDEERRSPLRRAGGHPQEAPLRTYYRIAGARLHHAI